MQILSRDNPKIKLYTRLRDKKSSRLNEGLFVLEGARIIADALKENAPLTAAFITDSAADKYSETAQKLRMRLGDALYVISDEIAEKLAGTVESQGIFAISRTLDKTENFGKIESGGKFIILNRLQDPGNIGTILRAADAVGISGVFLCNSVDLYNPKLVRSTMGSLFRVPVCDGLNYAEAVGRLRSAGVSTFAAVVDKDALGLRGFDFPENSAVVIGNEGSGLTADEANLCDGRLTIKMSGNIESLNAAAAATVFLWELCK